MNRRESALGLLAIGLAAGPPSAKAQQSGKIYRVGYLSAPTRSSVEPGVQAFLRALRDLGWVEGKNLLIEYRWAEGSIERLPELAAELVRLRMDLIVAPAGSAALAAKGATATIPIVMIFPSDPVEMGLIASLRRPGGNITGTTFTSGPEIYGKQLQILKETIPRLSRMAILSNPVDPSSAIQMREVEGAARSLRIVVQHVEARGPEEFAGAFAAMTRERADALLVHATSTFLAHRARIAELAVKAQLPTMCSFREIVEAGALMAYAVSMRDFVERAASYVDKILKGASPADLPVEQPTKFSLVINQKTARALGLAIPQSVLASADEVIQ